MQRSRVRRAAVALALAAVLVPVSGASAQAASVGHVRAPDRVLRHGCHDYHYRYAVHPDSDDWLLETWIYDPRGKHRGAGDFAPGSDARRERVRFGLCRSTVVPGRFTIKARLTWYTPGALPIDPPTEHRQWLKPARFRLHR